MHVKLIGVSKLTLAVTVSLDGCLSHLSVCGLVIDWPPVQGVPRISPSDSWDRLLPPHDTELDIEDGWTMSQDYYKDTAG